MNNVWIFDLDDTIYSNQPDYDNSITKFWKFLQNKLGYQKPKEQFKELFNRIDKKQINVLNPRTNVPYGYSMDRFPHSMIKFYQQICQQQNISFNQKLAESIQQIGYATFSKDLYKRKGLMKGAVETLNYLRKQGDQLILLTKGDKEAQKRKISALELENLFNEIFIVFSKTREVFEKVIEGASNTRKIWSVGNSFISDINPALGAGLGGIYIPYQTWESPSKDTGEFLRVSKRNVVLMFPEIIEIKKNYEKIEKQ